MSKKKVDEEDYTIVSTINPIGKESKELIYPVSTASIDIAKDATSFVGLKKLEPEYFEVVTETVERSKGWGEGIKFAVEVPKLGRFEFEKKHKKEAKTIKKAIFRSP